jgi:uncharacterized protein YegL
LRIGCVLHFKTFGKIEKTAKVTMTAKFDPSKFTTTQPKPLPVVLLLDRSASMSGSFDRPEVAARSKIAVLNEAVKRMLKTLSNEESPASEFLLSVITFGGNARLDFSPSPSSTFVFRDLSAGGNTPLGAALEIAKKLIEDRGLTPSRAYRPLVVLVSDGLPNDDWQMSLQAFIELGRSAKCDRMALGVGEDSITGDGRPVLDQFVSGTNHAVFEAKDADSIHKFFKFVTMSVVTRSLSVNPDDVPDDAVVKVPTKSTKATAPKVGQEQPDDKDSYW